MQNHMIVEVVVEFLWLTYNPTKLLDRLVHERKCTLV